MQGRRAISVDDGQAEVKLVRSSTEVAEAVANNMAKLRIKAALT